MAVRSSADLARSLEALEGRGYKAYRDIEGRWSFAEWTLFVDRVQSDPFAAPSKLRLRVPLSVAELPASALTPGPRAIAARAWLARSLRAAIRAVAPRRVGTGKGGLVTIDAGGPEVLDRTAVVYGWEAAPRRPARPADSPETDATDAPESVASRPDFVEARIEVGLPAAGRRALGREAARLLVETLPAIVTRAWIDRSEADDAALLHFVDCVENQEALRASLEERGLLAFVGADAILPRESGASERPMPREEALAFVPPEAFAVEIEVPRADAGAPGRVWHGMGIPRGVTLLVGGGYHGKSTLLRALEHAVVPHVPGDGRETVVADPALVKVRAEDGRAVTGVDIHRFIDRLPLRPGESRPRDTRDFTTPDASGSTSQAANIAEAIEAGARGLLLDEDTSATNFMVRDRRMQALIHPDDEPITPFVERVRALWEDLGVSTVLVMGSSGDYFDAADAVIELKAYRPIDVTARAKAIAEADPRDRAPSARDEPKGGEAGFAPPRARVPLAASFDARRGRKEVKLSSRDCEEIVYGTTAIDLRGVEQLFDPSQTRAIAGAIHLAATRFADGERSLAEILDVIDRFLDGEGEGQEGDPGGAPRRAEGQPASGLTAAGLDALDPFHRPGRHPGAYARPRRFEVAAAINRMRTLRVRARDAD